MTTVADLDDGEGNQRHTECKSWPRNHNIKRDILKHSATLTDLHKMLKNMAKQFRRRDACGVAEPEPRADQEDAEMSADAASGLLGQRKSSREAKSGGELLQSQEQRRGGRRSWS